MPPEYPDIALIISVAGVVIAAVGAILVYVQLRKNHEWNRRRASHDPLVGPYLDSFMPLYNHIRRKVNLFDKSKSFSDYALSFSADDLLILDQSLNFLENVCVLMRDNAIDVDVIYKSMGSLIPNYFRFFRP